MNIVNGENITEGVGRRVCLSGDVSDLRTPTRSSDKTSAYALLLDVGLIAESGAELQHEGVLQRSQWYHVPLGYLQQLLLSPGCRYKYSDFEITEL